MNNCLEKLRELLLILAEGRYDDVITATRSSRLSADDLRNVIENYGRELAIPPSLFEPDVLPIQNLDHPTWSVRAPLWTVEEGRSDLTLELTMSFIDNRIEVDLDDLHVL